MRLSRFLFVAVVVWASLFLGAIVTTASSEPTQVANVIFMILDGVGHYHYQLTRLVYGRLHIDDTFALGWVTTHSADANITASPAAATALATGYKTNNVMVSISPDGERLKTVLEYAQEKGMKTGLITTVMIYDATPAAFAAHNESRYNQAEIAADMLEHQVDVLLGGGRALFFDEDLITRAQELGYTYVKNEEELLRVAGGTVLGLFSDVEMSYELDRHLTNEPSIAQMTEKAIEILSTDNDNGFFLMVEGGRTDWAGHRNDAAAIAADLNAFDEAVGVAMQFADEDGNTLIVITSDHETGGLTFPESDHGYIASFLGQMTASADYIGSQMNKDRTNVQQVIRQYTPIEQLTPSEVRSIKDCGSGFQLGRLEPGNTIAAIISGYARTNFSSTYHTAADVPLFWYGAGAFEYSGTCDNTDIGKELIAIITESGVWSSSAVEWDQAASHVGTSITVAGAVAQSNWYEGTTYINLGNPYPALDMFTVAIPPECEKSFELRFGERPADYFDETYVLVHGEIELDEEGRPYIWLCDPDHIRLSGGGTATAMLRDERCYDSVSWGGGRAGCSR